MCGRNHPGRPYVTSGLVYNPGSKMRYYFTEVPSFVLIYHTCFLVTFGGGPFQALYPTVLLLAQSGLNRPWEDRIIQREGGDTIISIREKHRKGRGTVILMRWVSGWVLASFHFSYTDRSVSVLFCFVLGF